jgi:3-deoxy-7-phosphoheptulonate synthase
VLPLSRAAIAAGADGLIVDVHPEPAMALCDGDQALVDADLRKLGAEVSALAALMGRTLAPAPQPARVS